MKSKLNPRQALFCKEYMVDLNATKAAIRAKYSKKTAYSIGQENLNKPEIKRVIQEALEKRKAKIEITAQRILDELAKMGFANMEDYTRIQNGEAVIDLSMITRDQMAAVSEVTSEVYTEGRGGPEVKRTKLKIFDKKSSLELLGKHLKLFNGHSDSDKPADGLVHIDIKGLSAEQLVKLIMENIKK